MTLSFIANVGAEIVDLTPDYAKPGDTIDILSWDIYGPPGNTTLTQIIFRYNGTIYKDDTTDLEYAQFYANDTLLRTVYEAGLVVLAPEYLILENTMVTITMKFKIIENATHGNIVDGYIENYALTEPGALGTDGPADPAGYTIIDALNPYVVSATANPDPAMAGSVIIIVEFNEDMNWGVNPIVGVTGLKSPYPVVGGWSVSDTWVGSFVLSDENEVGTAYISVSGGQDFVGNVMEDAPTAGSFQVDTVGPNVVSISASDPMITDADIGNLFEITVTYNENMDMSVHPTISLSPDVTATLPSLVGFWTDGTHYVVNCSIADGNQEVAHVGVDVNGAQDIAGNPQGSVGLMHLFAIDNKNPTVVDITVSDDVISEADALGTFDVNVTFSEAMGTAPIISFTPDVTATLTSPSPAWSEGNTKYTVTYTIIDVNEESFVDVTVSGAQDMAGNSLVSKAEADLFSIDMLVPAAPAILDPVPGNYINIANQDAYTVFGFAEPGSTVEVRLRDGFGVNATATGSADGIIGMFSIGVNASGLGDGGVSVDARATDAAGNTGPWSALIPVMKDTVAPTVSITIADPINLGNVANVLVTIMSDEAGSYDYIISDGDVAHDVEGSGGILILEFFPLNLQTLDDGTITADASVEDAAGNVGHAPQDTATKDTAKPNVLSCQFSDTLISEADADDVFTVTVTYGEPMDPAFYPDITFNPATPGALIFSDEAWSLDTVYTANYTIKDVNEEVTVWVEIIGGRDLVGNMQDLTAVPLGINIDTIAPIPYMPPSLFLANDGDSNGIANIGDTLRIDVEMTSSDIAHITADLEAYGGSASQTLIPVFLLWTSEFIIVDSPSGIDVPALDPASAVKVTAIDFAGNIATWFSNNLAEPVDSLAPEPPTGLIATAIADGKIRLDWTASVAPDMGMGSYNIYRDTILVAEGVTGTTWTEPVPLAEIEHFYRMRSVDDANNTGDYSEEASATSDSTPPIAPTLDELGYINIANQNAYPVSGLAEAGSTVDVGLTDGVGFANATGSADAVSGQFTIAVDASGLDDGDVNISARATDTVGNTGLWSAPPKTVIKDTIEPTVTITIPEYINLSNVEAVSVNITSDEAGTYSYVIDGITDSGPIFTGVPIELLLNLSSLPDGLVTADASVEDAAGNVGHAEPDTATKDTIAPTVTITIPEYINLANVAEVPVIITSDEAGTYGYVIDGISDGGVISAGVPVDFLLDLNSLPDGPVTADASVEDAAGNVGHAEQDTATKDTVEPIAVDFHVSDILISDADVPDPFEVIVNFSEPMDTTFLPDIDFIPSVFSTLDFTGGLWSDLDTVYTATFEIFDAGVEILHVNLTIAGFVDLAGNFAFEQKNGTDVFDIDTKNPTVIGLEISDLWIREDDLPGPLTVTVNFSEPMSVAPNIGFSPDVSTTLLFDSDDWSVDSTVYTANYTIADVDEEASDITITVEDAEDIAGNLQVQYETDALFEIDTLHTTSKPVSIEVKANGEDSITVEIVDDVQLVATVLNWFGEPVSDEVLVLFETNFGTIYPDTVLTEDGEAETPISSTDVGTANVNATVDGISDSCTVTFVEQTFEIQLSLGWNLISVPRTLAYPAIEDVFAGITTIEKVWTYQNGEWYGAKYENATLTPIPGYLLEEIDDGKGYWIYTSEPVNITIKLKPLEYLALPPTYPLSAEWNLIGYTSIPMDEWMPIDSYLVYVEWSTLYRFGPYTYEIAKPGFYKYFDNFELGRGYWIHLNEEGTLVP